MKELLIFRIFALFPFIGIFIPDAASVINTSSLSIPAADIIVEITLFICIAICSAAIWIEENNMMKTAH